MAFNSTCWYIDDVLTFNNNDFHSNVDSLYPNELEIKDTTESSMHASYFDILLNIDINGKLTSQLYDKQDDSSFFIVNFPYICINIPSSPAYGMYVSQLIRYAREFSAYDHCLNRGMLLADKLLLQTFQQSHLKAAFSTVNAMVVIRILFTNMTYHWVKCCLICFIAIVKPFFTHWFDYGLFRSPDQDYGIAAGVTGQQGMLTLLRHLIPPLVCPGDAYSS